MTTAPLHTDDAPKPLAWLFLAYPVSVLVDAFTFWKLWHWFVVPVFDLPAFGFAAAVGIDALWSWAIMGLVRIERERLWETWLARMVGVGLLFLTGLVAHWCMG